ncbi:hypothetical protein DYB32_008096 [Aphanomyces invadans]|uniref:Tubulin--tyrosine ligase-like protein 5 n=1 Tax=Aphanomyces invadans TaxID=157072 RepID=A0A3R7CVZ6_9STRA|nr:hypothetical protein DYB32_008096 [Aphanomyces invadans]
MWLRENTETAGPAAADDDSDDDADSIGGDFSANEDDEEIEGATNEDEEEDDDDDDAMSPEICFDYPLDLHVTRTYDAGIVVEEIDASTSSTVFFKSYWERNCIKNAFFRAGLVRITKGKKWTAAWTKHMSRSKFKTLQPHQRINHFPDPWVIGRKDRLMKTLVAMKRKFGADYSFIPEGYVLPSQRDVFLRCLDRDAMSLSQSLWIVKPPASACGRGIKVIQASQVDTLKKTKKLVVQRYLASPYLIHGFKFDLRIYVVVTSFDPLRIYLFQEGLARFCTVKYSTSHLKNRLAHLTNFSVNKANAAFKASTSTTDTDGSKWSWTALMAYLADQGHDVDGLRAKMKAIICKTIIAAEAHITPLTQAFVRHRNVCYELFGFDMMIDSALEPWLIEVNVSPSLMGSSPLDKRIKGLLMSDIFHLVGHPVSMAAAPHVPPLSRNIPKPLANLNHSATSGSTPTKKPAGASKAATVAPLVARKQLVEVLHDPNIRALTPAHLALFRDDDWNIVLSMEDEADRVGHFERIYPAADAASYARYFSVSRYANRLCEKWRAMQPPFKPPFARPFPSSPPNSLKVTA